VREEPYNFSIAILRENEVLERDLPPLARYTVVDSASVAKFRNNFTAIVQVGLGEHLPLYVLKVTRERYETPEEQTEDIAEAIAASAHTYIEDAAGSPLLTPLIHRILDKPNQPAPETWSYFSVGNTKGAKRQRILSAKRAIELGCLRFVSGACEPLFDEVEEIDNSNRSPDDALDALGQALFRLDIERLYFKETQP
jgi:Terminase RNaseH-like domain